MSDEPSTELSVVRQDRSIIVATTHNENLLGLAEVNQVSAQLQELVKGEGTKLILDLASVQYAGSAALGMLLNLDQELRAKGGKLVLANIGRIEGLLRVSRTRGVFAVALIVNEAQGMV
jgi:anti-anti-sigma factor